MSRMTYYYGAAVTTGGDTERIGDLLNPAHTVSVTGSTLIRNERKLIGTNSSELLYDHSLHGADFNLLSIDVVGFGFVHLSLLYDTWTNGSPDASTNQRYRHVGLREGAPFNLATNVAWIDPTLATDAGVESNSVFPDLLNSGDRVNGQLVRIAATNLSTDAGVTVAWNLVG